MIRTNVFASLGASSQDKGGEMSLPLQEYFIYIFPWFLKAALDKIIT